ncbi:acylneuraminate cytidylyltransferase family protein [Clostridium botulinum]|uniref:acylneuraminate cytidylyltransferase family protein n=2 Tax=Clostridium botulinum TaxID=1491 RepID=UPI0013CA169A|nr:acylneuraminate cytidylyltransferase family protein [Clostridium botulinum]NFR22464.1 acylneuraminate cytidylyltransferase family protein [Clostridium botulinum]
MKVINNKSVLSIIPARGGSKEVPRKNIKNLNGKPLIAYSIEEARKSKYIDRTVVSTEDVEIAKVSQKFGAEVPCLRPLELSRDDSPTIDCVIHMLNWLREEQNYIPDYVCLLQCTSPLRTYEDIDGTIEKALTSNFDGAVSVCEAEVNPYWTNVFDGDKLKYFLEEGKQITRRQDLPRVYRINGSVYVIKTEILLDEEVLEPSNITGFIMRNKKSLDIDDNEDFMLADLLIKNKGDAK